MVTKEQIMKALDKCYFSILTCESYEDDVIRLMDFEILNRGNYDAGATKVVLYPMDKEANFVVKIPFTHDAEYISDHAEEKDFDFGEASFQNASEPDGWDYCEAETILYKFAEKAEIEFAFLKTELIGYSKDNHPIYTQPFAEMLESRRNSHDKDWRECQSASDFCTRHDLECFHPYWVADFLECYGEGAYERLHEFLFEFCIYDMHSGNLGYYKGKPVIIDYGGYHE